MGKKRARSTTKNLKKTTGDSKTKEDKKQCISSQLEKREVVVDFRLS